MCLLRSDRSFPPSRAADHACFAVLNLHPTEAKFETLSARVHCQKANLSSSAVQD